MSCAPKVIKVKGGAQVQVTVSPVHRVTLDRSTVAKINNNRPKTVPVVRSTPVNVTSRPTVVRTGGGMGVQGRPGAPGSSIPAISFAFGDAAGIVWTPTSAGLLVYARVIVDQVFNGIGASLIVGTNADPDAALPANYSDLSALQEFENTPDVHLAAGEGVRLSITPGSGATTGAGRLLLEFLPD